MVQSLILVVLAFLNRSYISAHGWVGLYITHTSGPNGCSIGGMLDVKLFTFFHQIALAFGTIDSWQHICLVFIISHFEKEKESFLAKNSFLNYLIIIFFLKAKKKTQANLVPLEETLKEAENKRFIRFFFKSKKNTTTKPCSIRRNIKGSRKQKIYR